MNDWRRFGLTSSTAVCRAIVGFGLQAFVPAYVIADLGHGEAVANATVTTFFAATLVGTLLGGQLADRFGFTRLVVGAIGVAAPLSLVLPVAGLPVVLAVVGLLGVIGGAYFYPLVVLAQRAVPSHLGLAAGVVLGMSIGLGSAVAFPLGMLADDHGPAAALWAISGFSLLSLLLVAGLVPRRATSSQASVETAA